MPGDGSDVGRAAKVPWCVQSWVSGGPSTSLIRSNGDFAHSKPPAQVVLRGVFRHESREMVIPPRPPAKPGAPVNARVRASTCVEQRGPDQGLPGTTSSFPDRPQGTLLAAVSAMRRVSQTLAQRLLSVMVANHRNSLGRGASSPSNLLSQPSFFVAAGLEG